ncbi:hypothetical protein EVAR_49044_1 [Eumeta japonica]|uniref:Uncharacterized protein n=1 Tax=Eumeta variegata TaxID=151549 RepID=A0A4C2A1M6_EUMVA|nr:hypothetical protein EVAR_49044_1 [Eumeta japonica]
MEREWDENRNLARNWCCDGFRRKAILWSAVLNILVTLTESSPYPPALSSLQTFTLEELVPLNPEFYPDRVAVQWISGTEYVFMEPGEGIKKYNALTDTYETFLEDSVLANLSQYHLTSFSKDGKRLLLSAHKKKVSD